MAFLVAVLVGPLKGLLARGGYPPVPLTLEVLLDLVITRRWSLLEHRNIVEGGRLLLVYVVVDFEGLVVAGPLVA